MRRNPTEPERKLWMSLRDRRFESLKFRRQTVIGYRIVDFFCPAKGLIVELDGDTHNAETDQRRDEAMLRDFGFSTVRFVNPDVMHNLEGVLIALQRRLAAMPGRWGQSREHHPPTPSSEEEGELTVAEAIRDATVQLGEGTDTARLDAELLMAEALDCTRSELFLRRMHDPAPASYAALVERRAAHEPVAYIRGYQEFFGLGFRVTPDVLIPRGDSEVLVEAALAAKPAARRVLDLGTGSGALLLAALSELPAAEGVGIDRSIAALTVATANARALGLAERTRLEFADWTEHGWNEGLGAFDVILANPPYVETAAELSPDVRSHEPHEALFAGPDGLDDYRVLIPQLPALLGPGGIAMIEIGSAQADAVTSIARESGFEVSLHHDLGGRPRALELNISLGKAAPSA